MLPASLLSRGAGQRARRGGLESRQPYAPDQRPRQLPDLDGALQIDVRERVVAHAVRGAAHGPPAALEKERSRYVVGHPTVAGDRLHPTDAPLPEIP